MSIPESQPESQRESQPASKIETQPEPLSSDHRFMHRGLRFFLIGLPVIFVLMIYPAFQAMFPDGYGTPKFLEISVGLRHSCGITEDHRVKCWGENKFGQIGQPVTSRGFLAPMLVPALEDAVHISVAGDFSCAVISDGSVKCWGGNHLGQIGNDEFADSQIPVTVQGLKDVKSLVTTPTAACIIDGHSDVRCWGSQEFSFINADPMLAHSRQIALGRAHACALDEQGRVTCWGDNRYGLSTASARGTAGFAAAKVNYSPRRIAGVEKAKFIVASGTHNCVITSTDTVACWGDNSNGQLGGSSLPFSGIPIEVSNLKHVVSIAASDSQTCAITVEGRVSCWGDGHLAAPAGEIQGLSDFKLGENHGCVLRADGLTSCWGSNSFGALGNNSWESESVRPVAVTNSNFVKQTLSLFALQARLASTNQE